MKNLVINIVFDNTSHIFQNSIKTGRVYIFLSNKHTQNPTINGRFNFGNSFLNLKNDPYSQLEQPKILWKRRAIQKFYNLDTIYVLAPISPFLYPDRIRERDCSTLATYCTIVRPKSAENRLTRVCRRVRPVIFATNGRI